MNGFLKDDLTVALDEVDRTASRIVTIYEDLSDLASEPEVAARLRQAGERYRRALVAFNHARRAAGQIPEVADPERAHLQSLWMALRSAVSGEASREHLEHALDELDEELRRAVAAARKLDPDPALRDALARLEQDLCR